ncbi:hypothetical protein DERF_003341 [Dermatophagoides farinae]|uniref:Uncharacterized protein n=1 Tax=Dermatophagoides farinae TaxID=6954 RepID=A0A922IDD6_DERFA|nr:hypothetical protein DERF_003341 [Dermatophagoides farinae]
MFAKKKLEPPGVGQYNFKKKNDPIFLEMIRYSRCDDDCDEMIDEEFCCTITPCICDCDCCIPDV